MPVLLTVSWFYIGYDECIAHHINTHPKITDPFETDNVHNLPHSSVIGGSQFAQITP